MTSGAEIFAVLKLARECESAGVRTALARLVSVEGSHYRRPGARMLLAENRRSAGAISAGCLESDLWGRLSDVLASGRTELLEYDSRSYDDLVWGLGSGCNGAVRVLLSPFVGPLRKSLSRVGEILAGGETAFLATVVAPSAGSPFATGEAILLDGLEKAPREDGTDLFVETIRPPISLLIAGAGPDSVVLARMATILGWSVSVLSTRDRSFLSERFAGLPVELAGSPEGGGAQRLHSRSAAIVMSHGFSDDAAALESLLPRDLAYLGVLGPRERTRRLLDSCGAPADAGARIHSPAGLRLGAETAEEIALSIVSEIQSLLAG